MTELLYNASYALHIDTQRETIIISTHKLFESGFTARVDSLQKLQSVVRPPVYHVHSNTAVHVMLQDGGGGESSRYNQTQGSTKCFFRL